MGKVWSLTERLSVAHVGDTLHRVGEKVELMPGFKPAKAMVYAGVYPMDSNDFNKLEESIRRVCLCLMGHSL